MKKKRILIFLITFIVNCCSSNNEMPLDQTLIKSDTSLYIEAFKKLKAGDYEESSELFSELDLLHPYSKWAIKGQLMSGFSLYQENNYEEAIFVLNKFINLNPNDKNLDYAHYLKGFCFYERINNVSRDQEMAKKAEQTFTELKNKFPNSKYSVKAQQHLKMLNNQLAGYEMTVGKYYQKKGRFIAATLRYKTIVKKYQNSAQIPESLYRIIECYLSLGIEPKAISLSNILRFNFPDSIWTKEGLDLMKKNNIKLVNNKLMENKYKVNINDINLDIFNF